jgi:MerR family transcriptional regulator, light-induced transcriptional regulator
VSAEDRLIEATRLDLERCLREHDRPGAVLAVLAAVDAGLPIEELYSSVLQPFLALVGSKWQAGRTKVWEEHLIVGAIRTAIEALYPKVVERKSQVKPIPLTVAFFCPPEETHDVGLRMLVDRFDLRGFRTVYVGAGTPVDEMINCARAEGATVVCLSASTHFQRATLHNVIEKLRWELPDVRILAGGPAFAQSIAGWEEFAVGSVDELLDRLATEAQGPQAGKLPGA